MRKKASVRQDKVLGILSNCAKPMTAYEILECLKAKEPDIAPPTVYRARSALTDQGRAHRLESIKAFVPCKCDHADGVPVLAICNTCGSVEEHDGQDLLQTLTALANKNTFQSERHIVEIQGYCSECLA